MGSWPKTFSYSSYSQFLVCSEQVKQILRRACLVLRETEAGGVSRLLPDAVGSAYLSVNDSSYGRGSVFAFYFHSWFINACALIQWKAC